MSCQSSITVHKSNRIELKAMNLSTLKESKEAAVKQIDLLRHPPKNKKTEIEQEERITVLLVDDHQMFRNSLRTIIEDQDDITVVGEAGNGEEAVRLSQKTSPNIILMDVNMPRMDGIEATNKISVDMPNIRIIGLSLHDSREIKQHMRNAGASAYLTKTNAYKSLVVTIREEALT